MEYLIKDLSAMTGLSPARIRKWQERHRILEPRSAANGYWYYSNDDFFVLRNIARRLKDGETLRKILEAGRASLLAPDPVGTEDFTQREWAFIQAVGKGDNSALESHLWRAPEEAFDAWQSRLSRAMVIVGAAWERGYVSVADEHAFSAWFSGFYLNGIGRQNGSGRPEWLVVSFPGDEHTLGALLRFGEIVHEGGAARFCGMLPEKELVGELYSQDYKKLSISVVMPRPRADLDNLYARIKARFPALEIEFGGPAEVTRAYQSETNETGAGK